MKKSIDKSNLIAYNSIHKDCAQSNCKQIKWIIKEQSEKNPKGKITKQENSKKEMRR